MRSLNKNANFHVPYFPNEFAVDLRPAATKLPLGMGLGNGTGSSFNSLLGAAAATTAAPLRSARNLSRIDLRVASSRSESSESLEIGTTSASSSTSCKRTGEPAWVLWTAVDGRTNKSSSSSSSSALANIEPGRVSDGPLFCNGRFASHVSGAVLAGAPGKSGGCITCD